MSTDEEYERLRAKYLTKDPRQQQRDADERTCRGMVREMLDAEDKGFSDGEIDFLESLHRWSRTYTPAQRDAIENIYKRRM